MNAHETDAISLAEQVLVLLDRGSFMATYKYAVLLALLDICLQNTDKSGAAPTSITTRQLADKVIELYWGQVQRFDGSGVILSQIGGRPGQKASILEEVTSLRMHAEDELGTSSLFKLRNLEPCTYERALHRIERTLIEFPLPRLQKVGNSNVPFLYELGWALPAQMSLVRKYQRGATTDFDNRLLLLPNVGEHLIRLNGLLRGIIQRHWTQAVSQINQLKEERLENFLFGEERSNLTPVRTPLIEHQKGRCFYCHRNLRDDVHVDHFIPWSRFPSNEIHNLVAAHALCNLRKSNYLASLRHLSSWVHRNDESGTTMIDIAANHRWPCSRLTTSSVLRGVYLRLPAASRLWVSGANFEVLEKSRCREILMLDEVHGA